MRNCGMRNIDADCGMAVGLGLELGSGLGL